MDVCSAYSKPIKPCFFILKTYAKKRQFDYNQNEAENIHFYMCVNIEKTLLIVCRDKI